MSEPDVQDTRLHEQRLNVAWAHAYADGTLPVVLEALYDHEINVGFQSFWDAGWTVWFGAGEAWQDVKVQEQFSRESFAEIAPWLIRTAEDYYPALKRARLTMSWA